MKKLFNIVVSIVVVFPLLTTSRLAAQVAVNTTGAVANSTAMLDVSSSNKGLLIPRMTSQEREAIQNPAIGLLVYQTDYPDGFYYRGLWGWENLTTVNGSWGLKGNAGTNPYQDFIGTTDAQDLGFRVNNGYKLKITPKGQLETYGTGLSVFLGFMAGSNDDLTNNKNVFVGCSAGNKNTSGEYNSAVGFGSMENSSTGNNNSIFGYQSLNKNSSGNNNSAFGYQSLYNHISGNENVAIGNATLYTDTSGTSNTAIGSGSMKYNTSGSNNTAVGFESLIFNNQGSFNVAIGNESLNQNYTGNNNVGIGNKAAFSNSSGLSNIAIGVASLYNNTAKSYLIAIGDSALFHNGENAIYNFEGTANIAIGLKALFSNTTGAYNVAIGDHALYANSSGVLNTSIGYQSLKSNTTGYYNTAISNNSLSSNTSGHENTAVGTYSLFINTTGSNNTTMGTGSLFGNTTGSSNVAMGVSALYNNSINSNLVAIGDSALYNNGTGGSSNIDGAANVAVGSKALFTNNLGNSNTAVGYHALYYNSLGNNNIALGYKAGENVTLGANNIIIGYNVSAPSRTDSNRMIIGNLIFANGIDGIGTNLSSGNVGIGVSNPTAKLEVNGQVKITGGNPGAGKVLQSDADGLASWETLPVDVDIHDVLYDADSNTLIQVEKNANEDKIRFDMGGVEYFVLDSGRIEVKNTGNSVFLGDEAGLNDDLTTNRNTFVGYQSGKANTYGANNVAVGNQTLLNATSGSYNVAVGNIAGKDITSGWYNIMIGYNTQPTAPTTSSQLNIGNIIYGTGISLTTPKIGIGVTNPAEKLDVLGNFQVKQTSGPVYANIESGTSGASLYLKASGSALAQVKFYDNGSYGASMGYDNAQDRIFFYHNTNVFIKNGDVLPGFHKGGNLGADGMAWNNIYYDDLFNQGAAAFTNRKVTKEITNHPPKPKKAGSFDYKTKRGDVELDPKSLPDGLHENNAILTDEMSTYNYKVNYEQQLIINRQQQTINQQQQTINDLSKRLERLEKRMGK